MIDFLYVFAYLLGVRGAYTTMGICQTVEKKKMTLEQKIWLSVAWPYLVTVACVLIINKEDGTE